jgi:HEPN domain-containing protein
MARGKVTESYSDMFIIGERDIAAIVKIVDKFGYNDGVMNIDIVSHANLAVEKFLKGYLIKNNIDVEKTHDLDLLSTMASDSVKLLENIYNFEEIKNIRDELRNTNKKYPQEENLLKKVMSQ